MINVIYMHNKTAITPMLRKCVILISWINGKLRIKHFPLKLRALTIVFRTFSSSFPPFSQVVWCSVSSLQRTVLSLGLCTCLSHCFDLPPPISPSQHLCILEVSDEMSLPKKGLPWISLTSLAFLAVCSQRILNVHYWIVTSHVIMYSGSQAL